MNIFPFGWCNERNKYIHFLSQSTDGYQLTNSVKTCQNGYNFVSNAKHALIAAYDLAPNIPFTNT